MIFYQLYWVRIQSFGFHPFGWLSNPSVCFQLFMLARHYVSCYPFHSFQTVPQAKVIHSAAVIMERPLISYRMDHAYVPLTP
jgi:hypothetical protein